MNKARVDGLLIKTTGLSSEPEQAKDHLMLTLDNYGRVLTVIQATALHAMLGETLDLIRPE